MAEGPSCWHIVDDGVFSISLTGTRQSPINIETDKNVIETDEALDDLKFEYVPANSTQVNCEDSVLCYFIPEKMRRWETRGRPGKWMLRLTDQVRITIIWASV